MYNSKEIFWMILGHFGKFDCISLNDSAMTTVNFAELRPFMNERTSLMSERGCFEFVICIMEMM